MKRISSSAASSLPLESIEVFVLDTLPTRRRAIPTGPTNYGGGGSWAGRPVLMCIRAGGISGWGEIRPVNPFLAETAASMFFALRDFYAPIIVGRDAFNIESILCACERHLPGNAGALALIDMSLHDLVGKALGVPVHVLLGGVCKERIPMEWSVGVGDEKTMIEESVMAVEKYGIEYVCLKVGPANRIDLDVRMVKAIRKSVGPGVFLGIDANTTYDPASAVQLLDRLADVRLTYFEQPVAAHALRDMRWIRERGGVPILADESVYSRSDAMQIVHAGAADVLGLKSFKCGGMRRSREIASIAEGGALRVNCAGCANGSYIEAIAGAHLCSAIPNHAFGAEFVMGLPAVEEDLRIRNRPIDVVDGYCNIPGGPGLGFELNEAALKPHQLAHAVVNAGGR